MLTAKGDASIADALDELKRKSVLSHRILTMTGSMGDLTGHVMVRVPGSRELIVRCRNATDWSPGFVGEAALHRVDFDGNPTEDVGDWVLPPERYIGVEIMKARPEVNCVIHAHPPAQILCSITGVEIRPIIGAPNFEASILVSGGVPLFPRSVLVASPELGRALVAVMGSKDICLLQAHGNVVTGRTIEEATVRAIQLENLARLCWTAAAAGKQVPTLSWQDSDEFLNPQQAAAKHVRVGGSADWVFRYYVKALEEGRPLHVEMGVEQP